jgi:uncharacterized membrane protein YbhN (UPF0104 family)
LVRVAKVLIAIAVVVGLYFAALSAVTQWKIESDKLRLQIAEIDQALKQTDQTAARSELQKSRDKLQATVPRLENLRWDRVGLASLLYAIGLIPPSFLLRRALLSLGQKPSVGTAIAAQLVGHVGKYVPGKAMVVILRAGALTRDGVRPLAATVSVFLETFLMMAVGAAVAGAVVVWLPVPSWIAITAVLVAILASLPTLPPILRRVAARVSKLDVAEIDAKIGMGLFAAGWGWSLLGWLLIGASFTALITAIPSSAPSPPPLELYATATAAISLAIVVGFASLLPGGAGVRELVLITVLSVSIGSVHGLLAAIAARIMFIVVESVLAGAAWTWLRLTDGSVISAEHD